MKRYGNLYSEICSMENLRLADHRARKGKSDRWGVRVFDRDRETNLRRTRRRLLNRTYKTSTYDIFTIKEKKERVIYRLPYYPDRIVHHAIMNVLERFFIAMFTRDTYSCIRGRGLHKALNRLKNSLKDFNGTVYCLKLDIKQFYPSVNHDTLKKQLRRKFKDQDLLWLLEEIIDSAPGIPIGNYLSQYFANFYMTGFDHWIKEVKGIKYYFRYADDLVILAGSKEELHSLLADIKVYLKEYLQLSVKHNYQVFPVDSRGIDFLGYKAFHKYILLRKSIKQEFARKLSKGCSLQTIASYWGWLKHCDSVNLTRSLLFKKEAA